MELRSELPWAQSGPGVPLHCPWALRAHWLTSAASPRTAAGATPQPDALHGAAPATSQVGPGRAMALGSSHSSLIQAVPGDRSSGCSHHLGWAMCPP